MVLVLIEVSFFCTQIANIVPWKAVKEVEKDILGYKNYSTVDLFKKGTFSEFVN